MDMSRARSENELALLRRFASPDEKQLAAIREAVVCLQTEIDDYGERQEKLTPWALVQWENEPWVPPNIQAASTKVQNRFQKAAVSVVATKRMTATKAAKKTDSKDAAVKLRIDSVLGDMSRTLDDKLPSSFTERLPGIPRSRDVKIESTNTPAKVLRKSRSAAAPTESGAGSAASATGGAGSATGFESAFLADLYSDCRRQRQIKPPPKQVEVKKSRRQRDAEAAAAAAAAAEAATKKPKRKLPPKKPPKGPGVTSAPEGAASAAGKDEHRPPASLLESPAAKGPKPPSTPPEEKAEHPANGQTRKNGDVALSNSAVQKQPSTPLEEQQVERPSTAEQPVLSPDEGSSFDFDPTIDILR